MTISFLFSLIFFFNQAYADCPAGTIEGITPGNCYQIFPSPTNWVAAEENCMRIYGHLTSVTSAFQNAFLQDEIQQLLVNVDTVWIGGNSIVNPGAWGWSDGTSFGYANWAKGQPTRNQNLCASTSGKNGSWYSLDCVNTNLPYICKVNATRQTQTTQTNTLTTSIAYTGSCPTGYTYSNQTNFCYKYYYPINTTFNQSEAFCQQYGGHLASIHSDAENSVVGVVGYPAANISCPSCGFWIGAINSYGNSTWTDGTTFDYSGWYNFGGTCCGAYVELNGSDEYQKWDCEGCDRQDLGFVCKVNPLF